MDNIWVVLSFWPLWILLLWTLVYKLLCGRMLSYMFFNLCNGIREHKVERIQDPSTYHPHPKISFLNRPYFRKELDLTKAFRESLSLGYSELQGLGALFRSNFYCSKFSLLSFGGSGEEGHKLLTGELISACIYMTAHSFNCFYAFHCFLSPFAGL